MMSWRLIIFCVLLLVLDQITKAWVLAHFHEFERLPITSFFNLVLVFNTGAAFSFLAGASGWQNGFFIGVAILAGIVIVVLIRRAHVALERYSLALVLAGAWGNLIDRVLLGKVVDFLDFHAWGWHFPAFNVADSCISVGVALLLYLTFFPPQKPSPH